MTAKTKLILAALALLASAAPALAEQPYNLRFYSLLQKTSDVFLDNARLGGDGVESIVLFHVAPGDHTLRVVEDGGDAIASNVTFADSNLAESRGKLWWCVIVARPDPDHRLVMKLLAPAACKSLADIAPPDDASREH